MSDEVFIFDAHLDLSMNALEWNRDLTLTTSEIRQREKEMQDKPDRGRGTVALPDMRKGRVGICVATMIARYVEPDNPLPGWSSPEIAWAQTQGQLSWYQAMEEAGQMVQIVDIQGLDAHLALWEQNSGNELPIGYVLSLEGADSILTPDHLQRAYQQGLRALGPAHYGPGRYAQGTHATGGLGSPGRELLAEMESLGIILDVTHLCDESFAEAVDYYHGPLWASHSNSRTLVPHERQFTDEQMRLLIDRGAVIGAVLDAWMLSPDWQRGVTTPDSADVRLKDVVDQIDYVCQLSGNAKHAGIGSDLDGGFGTEQSPRDLDTIADLQLIAHLLGERGYNTEDIAGIMHGNWLRFLRQAWS